MTLAHTPLDPSRLSAAAHKALAPGPGRLMAARGLVPLPRPGDLAAVLYQLALDGDAAIAQAAVASRDALPERVLAGVLGEADVDPRVIDWLAPACVATAALHDALITAPSVGDETIAALAARDDARGVDLIAHNELRLLRHPDIIAAMYVNPRARMSTVDRAVELAVRNHVKVSGIPAWDELCRLLQAGSGRAAPADDAVFAQAVAGLAEVDDSHLTAGDADAVGIGADGELAGQEPPAVDHRNLPFDRLSVAAKIRLATIGNAVARAVLIRDPMRMVALAAIRAPGVTDVEAARYAGNQQLSDDVIRYIAQRREWTRFYGVKLHLIMNPKTPLPEVTRMLPHLRDKDLGRVARSKGIPSAVVAQARRLMTQRTPGGTGRR
jgi:hypothetical protein